jgi:ERCC4-related helicase/ERCC4-type nuclease
MVHYIEHKLIRPKTAEARLYQQVLAGNVLNDGNTMIVAPTALGKTLIAVLVAAERLNKIKNSKVLILAPSKPLAIQHEENFRNFLIPTCTSITGAVKTEERTKRWNESQIICATPQTVESDLLNDRYSLEDVSLMVFDECHHAVGAYSYVYLAARYVKEAKNHLILGLTASPGHDKSKINEVCQNLFIQKVKIKTEDDHDVKPYFNPIKIDWVKIELGKELEEIKNYINKALKIRLKGLKALGVIKTVSVSKLDVLKARGRVQNRIARSANPPKECFQAISILSAVINLQHSLELLETQGVLTFNKYVSRLRKKTTKAAKNLLLDPNFTKAIRLAHEAEEKGLEHPKLQKLIEILKKELAVDNSQTRLKSMRDTQDNTKIPKIIVFTQFRDTLDMIHQKCEKEGIKSVKFFGQGSRDGEKGLTQKEQKSIIKSFKTGSYDVLLSTSVAEEGIDIPAVDLVILYEPVPSEVRMIQRRGRTGRKNTGKMKVLITKGTRDEGYYWSSIRKEDKMKNQLLTKEAIEDLDLDAKSRIASVKSERVKKPKIVDDGLDEELFGDDNKEISIEGNLDLSPKNQKLVVYVDSREGNSNVIRDLDMIGVDVKIRAMTVADYQVSNDVAIERKTAKDFVDSIADKRLFKQARMMMEEFKKPILILEGDDFYSGFINPDAIRGSIASIALDFGISIIPTRSPEDTAAMIKRIAAREQKNEKHNIQIRTERKPVNLWEQQLFIVESLPNVGPVNAKNLLEHFGTVKKVLNASESELLEVEGIGKKTAKNIKEVLDEQYLYFKKEVKDKKLM